MAAIDSLLAALEASIAADEDAREASARTSLVTAFADDVIAALEASIAADEDAREASASA